MRHNAIKMLSVGLFLLLCLPVTAQKIKLTILEKGTEQPMIAANVAVADNEKMENPVYAITGIDGVAQINRPKTGRCHYRITST